MPVRLPSLKVVQMAPWVRKIILGLRVIACDFIMPVVPGASGDSSDVDLGRSSTAIRDTDWPTLQSAISQSSQTSSGPNVVSSKPKDKPKRRVSRFRSNSYVTSEHCICRLPRWHRARGCEVPSYFWYLSEEEMGTSEHWVYFPETGWIWWQRSLSRCKVEQSFR